MEILCAKQKAKKARLLAYTGRNGSGGQGGGRALGALVAGLTVAAVGSASGLDTEEAASRSMSSWAMPRLSYWERDTLDRTLSIEEVLEFTEIARRIRTLRI